MQKTKFNTFDELRWDELSDGCKRNLLLIAEEAKKNKKCFWTRGCKKGYPIVSLCYANRVTRQITVHRFVMLFYFKNIPLGFEVDHIDRDRMNFSLSNLRVCSHSANVLNTDLELLHDRCVKPSKARDLEKLKESQKKKRVFKQEVYLEIIRMHSEGLGYDKLASLYGISKAGIAYIIRNKENYL